MSLFGVKDWICDFLHSPCMTPTRYTFLKPFHYTVCFFHKIICNDNDGNLNNSINDNNLIKRNFVLTNSQCNLTHYFTDVLGKICSSSCNISYLQVQYKSSSNESSCKIGDYFNIWLNESMNSVFTRVNCISLNSEEKCYNNWCYIYDYTKFTLTELYKKWCNLVGCVFKQKMQYQTEAILIEEKNSRLEKWIRNWISQHLGIQWPRNITFAQFVIYFCTVGGIFLLILLTVRRKIIKSKTESKSLNLEDIDEKLAQMLIDFLAKSKSDYENLKKELEQNNIESFEIIENLNKQINDFKIEINALLNEHLIKQKYTEEETCKLEQKCVEYENQIINLNQQLQNQQTENIIKQEFQQNIQTSLDRAIADKSTSTENLYKSSKECETLNKEEEEDPYVRESLKEIDAIFKNTQELEKQIEEFSGSENHKTFLHLNELLIRNIIKLDNIETGGQFIIRNRRKDVLLYIHNCKSNLKSKVIN